MNLYNLTTQFSYLEGNTSKNKNKVFTTFLHIFHGSRETPPWKTPTRKIPTHQTPPPVNPPRKIPTKSPPGIFPPVSLIRRYYKRLCFSLNPSFYP